MVVVPTDSQASWVVLYSEKVERVSAAVSPVEELLPVQKAPGTVEVEKEPG